MLNRYTSLQSISYSGIPDHSQWVDYADHRERQFYSEYTSNSTNAQSHHRKRQKEKHFAKRKDETPAKVTATHARDGAQSTQTQAAKKQPRNTGRANKAQTYDTHDGTIESPITNKGNKHKEERKDRAAQLSIVQHIENALRAPTPTSRGRRTPTPLMQRLVTRWNS